MIRTLVITVLLAVGFRWFIYEPFTIPSQSMEPTLLVGDYILVAKFAYGFNRFTTPVPISAGGRLLARTPERGDVVVFRSPRQPGVDFVKRVIGLPGDRIQVVGGLLHINGDVVLRQPLEPYLYRRTDGRIKWAPQYIESLPGGLDHRIIEVDGDTGRRDNTQTYGIPNGFLLMMGDNRDRSIDSRESSVVGLVPVDHLVGRAEWVFFSLADGARLQEVWRWPGSARLGRLGRAIR
jgi:signal peptidase I